MAGTATRQSGGSVSEASLVIESFAVRLSQLFAGVDGRRLAGAADADIASLSFRSDESAPGSLFFCVPGFKRDGHDFAADAVAHGAAALCVERELDLPVAQAVVPSVRGAMGPVAAAFFGDPGDRLLTVGITGTNGKTTSAFLIAHLLDRAGLRAGLMGTVERRIGGKTLPAGRTTPEAVDVQRDFADMVKAGDKAVVMEVSSHALDLGRVLGTRYRAVAFTNLTQDHLDYHKTIEDYYAAKCLLFLDPRYRAEPQYAIINVDDPFGRELAAKYPRERLLGFSTTGAAGEWGPADLEWSEYEIKPGGTRGTMVLRGAALELARATAPGGRSAGAAFGAGEARYEVSTPLVGGFNVANTLTALGVCLALGLDLERTIGALGDFRGVPGRMEPVVAGQDFTVLVDYAHTPDSVRNALHAARGFTRGRLIAVLGCGGDRDKGKRPLMGREAEEAADLVIVTSDNPRTEDPLAIIADITAGLAAAERAKVQPDRRLAIRMAMAEARAGDVVLILGKGHESGQEFATETLPFDDRQVAHEALLAPGGEAR
jgi:UDP-N-acetylmuramoyl-L-alanyl-D-glutamate--2,6-diaminopimelate ligase